MNPIHNIISPLAKAAGYYPEAYNGEKAHGMLIRTKHGGTVLVVATGLEAAQNNPEAIKQLALSRYKNALATIKANEPCNYGGLKTTGNYRHA